jgi:hypothetical protein
METVAEGTKLDIDLACSLTAAERRDRGDDWHQLLAGADEVRELEDGFALRFRSDEGWIARASALIVAERTCCPFFRFTLDFEPGEGPVWLHIAGPGGVKAFIWDQMLPSGRRP